MSDTRINDTGQRQLLFKQPDKIWHKNKKFPRIKNSFTRVKRDPDVGAIF